MSDKTEGLYKELLEKIKEVTLLEGVGSLLNWDERTYMPKGGSENRADQIGYISGLSHQKATDPRIGELLSVLEQSEFARDPESESAANLREIRRDYDKLVKIPQKLVEEISRTSSMSQGVWVEARKENDFKKFLPWLQKILKLNREKAELLGYKNELYDALLDEFEPGSTVEYIAGVFKPLREELVALVGAITDSGRKPDLSIIERDFPIERQAVFGQEAAAAIGYNFENGRLDISAHPFTTGIGPGDTRITTRYNPRHFGQALFGTLHEAGHGIYDQNLPKEHYGSPLGESVSLGIHESQSRMWENQVGRSRSFWRHFFPRAKQMFPEAFGKTGFDDFYFAINDVRPSLIRVEADEVTYNLHIMLRFELEHAMVKEDLGTGDLPGAWNEKFKEFFGIQPPNDADGCLQDIHWPAGYFGYFPTYSLGNLYAAQFFAKVKEVIPDIEDHFAEGNFSLLKEWLIKNIHSHGRRYRAEKLCERVTGRPLSHKPLMDYLKAKFGELYGV